MAAEVRLLQNLRAREPRIVEATVLGAVMGLPGAALSFGLAWISMSLAMKCRAASAAVPCIVLAADQSFDWDRYNARQDACREADRIAQDCTRGVAWCDELALRQAKRACSAFGPLGEEKRR